MDVDAIEGVGSTQALDLDDDNSHSSQHYAEDQRMTIQRRRLFRQF